MLPYIHCIYQFLWCLSISCLFSPNRKLQVHIEQKRKILPYTSQTTGESSLILVVATNSGSLEQWSPTFASWWPGLGGEGNPTTQVEGWCTCVHEAPLARVTGWHMAWFQISHSLVVSRSLGVGDPYTGVSCWSFYTLTRKANWGGLFDLPQK